jgi:tripartite ATP-independent transporter DctM subunit
MMPIILAIIFVGTIIIGVPIAFSIGMTALVGLMLLGAPMQLAILKYFSGLDMFSFMAIPFFILAGELMNIAGITRVLVDFADLLVGRFRGGMAQINVVASMIFASITGSATSAASTLGTTMIPEMRKKGYDIDFSAGVIASASVLGPIIPPSILMIIVSSITDISVGALFISGFLPGLIFGFGLMTMVWIIARKKMYPRREERFQLKEIMIRGLRAIPAFFMPIIILGGVFSGVFSVTEASSVAVGYAFFYGMVRQPRSFLRELYGAFSRAIIVSVMILTVIGCAGIIGWVLAANMMAQRIADSFLEISRNPYIFLLLINIFYLIVGCLMEPGAAILITVPLLVPLAEKVGVHPLHFGLIVVLNLCIGFITPPVGLCLYVLCGITKLPLERLSRAVVPFFIIEVAALGLITYVPYLALMLPRLVGLIK